MKYKDNMQEGYLDSEGKFYDYGTELISGNNIIDTKHTGMSFYDDFLDSKNAKYMLEEKNLIGKVVMMSPEQYYSECARVCWPGRNVTVEKLKYERGVLGENNIKKLKQVVQHYKRKLCMPMINYTDPGQEGLHRMYVVGELYGWDFKVPVLIVTYADEERARKAAEEKRRREIDWKVDSAIQQTLRYKYKNKEELEGQLQWSLSEKFKYWDEIKVPDEITLEETDNSLILTFEGYEYTIEKDEVEWEEVNQELDDEDLDDIDTSGSNEDFLRRYFGDDWRITHPHLKDAFGIKESFNNSNSIVHKCAKEARNYITNKYGTGTDLCGRCIEASDYLVQLLNDKGVKAKTVEGYIVYDIDENCSDRAWDEHTWVELEDGTVVDVTVEQFNYQMYEDYPPILIEKDPHGYVYEKPNFLWLDDLTEEYEHDLIIKTKRRDNENDCSPYGHQVDFYKDGQKVGTCSVCGIKDNDAFIYDLQVFPEHRGKGYANDIMQYMIDKYDALHLYVDKDNYKAINLYKKFGWNIVGEAPEQEGQKPGWEMGRFETDFKPNLNESAEELTTVGLGIKLRKDIEKGWSKETCHPAHQSSWSLEYPSTGQCAITAMWLNEKMGWDIYETIVNRSRHFFNKDINGFIYDLTADQFQDSDIDYENCRKREFKDLYRSCKDRYELFKSNLNSLTESVERLDIKQMDEYIQTRFGADVPGEGCIFIATNGEFINIYPTLDDHEDLCYWLEENGFGDNPEDAEWFVDTFNYVRCRNSRRLCFVELPITNITRDQLYSLQQWFEEKVNTDFIDIELPDGTWNQYDLDEYFPEDLIKIIKRYYASGKLYECKKLN